MESSQEGNQGSHQGHQGVFVNSPKMGFIRDFFVRRQIKLAGYKGERHSVPLCDAKRCIVLLDVEDAETDACLTRLKVFLNGKGIEFKPFFLDMGKHGKDDIITTAVKTTILKRNLPLSGTLPKEIVAELQADSAEIYICLVDNSLPVTRCFNGIAPAPFCVGIADYDGSPFSMVFNGSAEEHIQVNFHDCAKRLESILDYLEMVV